MDEISNKLSGIDKIYKKINEMDDFSITLGDVGQWLNVWGKNRDELKAHVASLENENKELHSPSHQSFFPPPNIREILDSLTYLRTCWYSMYQDLMEKITEK